jgi:hypothetical protein
MPVAPEVLEHVAQQVHDEQRPVGLQQFLELDVLAFVQRLPVLQ